jgi:hypothetical protein
MPEIVAVEHCLCRCRGELADGGAKRSEDGGGGDATSDGELIAVGVGDLVDQAVSAQQAEFAAGPGSAAASFRRRGGRLREPKSLQVAIAQAVEGETHHD